MSFFPVVHPGDITHHPTRCAYARAASANVPWNVCDCGIYVQWLIAGDDKAARLAAAEAVCAEIDGRHPIALGDRVGALLAAWRAAKGTP